jgi:REP-associated tyrosine transposase
MPSRDRLDAPGALHHVGFQGNNRCRIVRDDKDANALALIRREAAAETGVTILSSADLDTHGHVYVRMREPNLAHFMQLLLGRYARAFNRRHGTEGQLFQGPYWSRRTTTQPQLLMALVYIALNPVRHGLCRHPREWRRGSYREIAGLAAPSGNVDVAAVCDTLVPGDIEAARREYVALVDEWCARVHERERAGHPAPG